MAGKEELKEDGLGGKTMNLNWMQLITLSQIVFSGDTFGFASGLVFLLRGEFKERSIY